MVIGIGIGIEKLALAIAGSMSEDTGGALSLLAVEENVQMAARIKG